MEDILNSINQKLRVVHFPQVATDVPFTYEVENEREAFVVSEAIAKQHLHLFEHKFIPDYSNVILVQMWNEEDKEWEDYWNDPEEMDWDELEQVYFRK